MSKETNQNGNGIGGIFRGLGDVVDLLSTLADRASTLDSQIERQGQVGNDDGLKAVYGFSLRVGGSGGAPVVQHFGNVKEDDEHGATVDERREPMVDVFDESDHVQLVAELPGVQQADIHFEVRHDVLELSAEGGDRHYHKEILLPAAVTQEGSKASYNNGIFELTLPKRAEGASTVSEAGPGEADEAGEAGEAGEA